MPTTKTGLKYFAKGSPQAKAHMAKLRALAARARGAKGKNPSRRRRIRFGASPYDVPARGVYKPIPLMPRRRKSPERSVCAKCFQAIRKGSVRKDPRDPSRRVCWECYYDLLDLRRRRNPKYWVHYKKPRSGKLWSIPVTARTSMEASRKAKVFAQGVPGYREYGISKREETGKRKNPLTRSERRRAKDLADLAQMDAIHAHDRGNVAESNFQSGRSVVYRGLAKTGTVATRLTGIGRRQVEAFRKGFRPNVAGELDRHAATDLLLFIENDGDLYRQQYQPIIKNLMAKRGRGVYDSAKAVTLFGYLVESGAKKYNREYGVETTPWHERFNTATRRWVATQLRDSFEVEAELGNYDHLLPAKYRRNPLTDPEITEIKDRVIARQMPRKSYARGYRMGKSDRGYRIAVEHGIVNRNPLTRPARRFVSKHIRRHVRGGMPQKRAIAAAYSEARRKGFKVPARAGAKRNPTLMTVLGNPGKKEAMVSRQRFEAALAKHGTAKQRSDYAKALASYKRFHGTLPTKITRTVINDGNKTRTNSTFLMKIGRAPDSTYVPTGGSNKGKTPYIHDWKTKPDVFVTPDGKTLIYKLRGKSRVSDWLRG